MKRMVAGILVMLTLLGMTGCAPLLERTYVTAEPPQQQILGERGSKHPAGGELSGCGQ